MDTLILLLLWFPVWIILGFVVYTLWGLLKVFFTIGKAPTYDPLDKYKE